MFCCFYELVTGTGVKLVESMQDCRDDCDCPFNYSGQCLVSEDVEIKLSKEKFGWTIDKRINFKELHQGKNKSFFFDKIIKLIHPIHSDLWLFCCLKEDKTTPFFFIYSNKVKSKIYENANDLSADLKERYMYDGRNLTIDDFKMEKRNAC